MRSYQDLAVGLALVLYAVAVRQTSLPRLVAPAMALSGAAYLAQGGISGIEGLTPAQSTAIVLSRALNLLWMIPMAVAPRRQREIYLHTSGIPSRVPR